MQMILNLKCEHCFGAMLPAIVLLSFHCVFLLAEDAGKVCGACVCSCLVALQGFLMFKLVHVGHDVVCAAVCC